MMIMYVAVIMIWGYNGSTQGDISAREPYIQSTGVYEGMIECEHAKDKLVLDAHENRPAWSVKGVCVPTEVAPAAPTNWSDR